MITRKDVLDQMEALSAQIRQAENEIEARQGAMQICRHWLKVIDEREAQAAEQAKTEALLNRNGTPAEGAPVEN